jgi:Amt family ammonium transporter
MKKIFFSLSLLFGSLFSIKSVYAATEMQRPQNIDEMYDLMTYVADHIWLAVAFMVVFLMKGGFLLFEAGMVRAKNTINTAQKNLTDTILSIILFYIIGYNMMFGESVNGVFGWTPGIDFHDVDHTFFIYQIVFCSMVATVVSGAVAERIKFESYMMSTIFVTLIIYPIFGHWAWGDKVIPGNSTYLIDNGFIDFAGSTVVCALGGWVALAALVVIGPRIGKFNDDGSVNYIPASNIVLSGFGAIILWVGAMAFNAGLAHAGSYELPHIMSNTILAGAFSGITSLILGRIKDGLFRPERCIYGILGGICAIAAGCHIFSAIDTIIVGIISGAMVFSAFHFLTDKLKIDDVVCAVPINAFCGSAGTLLVGFLADPKFFGGNSVYEQIWIQFVGVGMGFLWAFVVSYCFFYVVNKYYGMRVTPEEEIEGLNSAEHGVTMGTGILQEAMRDIVYGDGDLTVRLDETTGDESAEIATLFNKFVEKLQFLMVNISQNAKVLNASSNRLSNVSEDFSTSFGNIFDQSEKVSNVTKEVSAEVRDSAQASKEINNNISTIAENAKQMSKYMEEVSATVAGMMGSIKSVGTDVTQISGTTSQAKKLAGQASMKMSELEHATGKIDSVVELIRQIADKTNLLALNATIEASRAGEAGKGFIVVANEVKQLATQTRQATEEIFERITDIQGGTKDTNEMIGEVAEVIESINNAMSTISANIDKQSSDADIISGNVLESAKSAKAVSDSISTVVDSTNLVTENMDKASKHTSQVQNSSSKFTKAALDNQQNAQRVKQTSEDLSSVSNELTKIINKYKI